VKRNEEQEKGSTSAWKAATQARWDILLDLL